VLFGLTTVIAAGGFLLSLGLKPTQPATSVKASSG
jgi:hypothetical protein